MRARQLGSHARRPAFCEQSEREKPSGGVLKRRPRRQVRPARLPPTPGSCRLGLDSLQLFVQLFLIHEEGLKSRF